MRVGVIFGGRSGEHEVSLRSAASVMRALDPEKYEVLPIGVTKAGRWISGANALKALEAGVADSTRPVTLLGEPMDRALMVIDESSEALTLHEATQLDVVFPVLHGPFGEDGTVQGLLELAGVPYVGAGVVGSAVGMDKAVFKSVMLAHGLPILPYMLVTRRQWEADREGVLREAEMGLRYPMFVKPANLGSSVGVTKAKDRAQLAAGLDEAARYDRRLLVEQGIDAREIEVSVLGNEEISASVPGEIVPADEFYSYRAKYIDERSQLLIPAPLSDDLTETIQQIAVAAFRAIDGAGMGRVDFLLERETGAPYLNEVNTIPGFTSISMYPKLWEASGVPYPALLDRLIALALERHEDRQRNATSYDWRAKE
ncbi:MAG: D-alanine--D-alanine ligase [Anaerolineae bacterium]|nr:D-alanine--D-alanine ligase [Anaerolineae bacterium]